MPKAKFWNEVTYGLSDEHFNAVSERKHDIQTDFKVIQGKRF